MIGLLIRKAGSLWKNACILAISQELKPIENDIFNELSFIF